MKYAFVACLLLLELSILWTASATSPVRGTMVMDISPGHWDGLAVLRPWVINEGSHFTMWYAGMDAAGKTSIGLATSPDGAVWTKFANNPVMSVDSLGQWDGSSVLDPCVIYVKGEYKMWFTGERINPDGTVSWGIGYATSPDGSHWTKYSGNPVLTPSPKSWDSLQVWRPSVILTNSGYVMYYRGVGVGTQGAKAGVATSSDGIHWTKTVVLSIPPGKSGWDAYSRQIGALNIGNVVNVGDMYIMTYSSLKTQNPQRNEIGLASSTDGLDWTPYADNPVIAYGESGWDSGGVGAGTFGGSMLLIFNNQYYIYYVGASGSSDTVYPYRIGLAILPPVLTASTSTSSVTATQITATSSVPISRTSSSPALPVTSTVVTTAVTGLVISNEQIYLAVGLTFGIVFIVALAMIIRSRRGKTRAQ